jgi:hypothetical protein
MALIMIGIILNSLHIVHDQPQYSLETDPTHKLAAERHANYRFFHLQRARILKRQKRIGQYAWLVLGIFVASSWWLYQEAVKVTTASKQISSIRTVSAAGSDESVLSLLLNDGSTTEYLVKAPESGIKNALKLDERSKGSVPVLSVATLRTAIDVGDAMVPRGIVLNMVK